MVEVVQHYWSPRDLVGEEEELKEELEAGKEAEKEEYTLEYVKEEVRVIKTEEEREH